VLIFAIAVNFLLGALMQLGIGLYAPCLMLVSLLGMNPIAAFPIMMASCACLMPASSLKFQGFENQAMGLNLTYQGLLTDPMFQATLHAIQTSGKGRTLSVPRVTALNNREAKIRIGEDFRYFEQYDLRSVNTNERDSNNNPITRTELVPVGTPTLQELGIELTVTPSVGADRRSITLKTTPKITSFERFEYYTASSSSGSGNSSQTNGTGMLKLPIFKTSEVDTEVIAQSGDTIVMGGLISSTEGKTVNGIPILSSIPLIGRLFQSEGVNETKANLLIFVTATILSDRGENLIPEDEPAGEVGTQAAADETTVETTDEAASDQANDENK
jgi:type IV pilus assembly protein PilQ